MMFLIDFIGFSGNEMVERMKIPNEKCQKYKLRIIENNRKYWLGNSEIMTEKHDDITVLLAIYIN